MRYTDIMLCNRIIAIKLILLFKLFPNNLKNMTCSGVRAKLTADLKSAPSNYPRQLFTLKAAKILLPNVIEINTTSKFKISSIFKLKYCRFGFDF